MTNIEIKLELAKAALTNNNLMPTDDGLRNLYSWIMKEEPTEVSEPKTDYDAKPIAEVVSHIEKSDEEHCGYGVRLTNLFYRNDIKTVGDLLKIERRWFLRYRDVGRGSISRIDDALYELYGITVW